MTNHYAVPADLTREPWWPAVKSLSLQTVLDRLLENEDDHAWEVLQGHVFDAYGVSRYATRKEVAELLARETLGRWVAAWKPAQTKAAFGRIEELRGALTSLARVVMPPPDAGELGPLGAMRSWVFAARAEAAKSAVPRQVSYVLPAWDTPETISGFLESPLGARYGHADWFRRQAEELRQGVAQGEAARAARQERWRSATGPEVVTGLLALRERMAASELPLDEAHRDKASWCWSRVDDRIDVVVPGLLSCLSGPCQLATVSLAGAAPAVSCREGKAPCRLKLAAVEVAIEALLGEGLRSEELREHFARPAWERMLGRLQAAGAGAHGGDKSLGWVLRSATELAPAWVEPKKSGGWKSTKVNAHDLRGLEAQHPGDGPAIVLLDNLQYASEASKAERVGQALSALVGHERVFTRLGKELEPARVVREEPRVEVVQGERGARVVVRFGGQEVAEDDAPKPGRWIVKIDEAARVVRVGFWTQALHRAWVALRDEAHAAMPPESAAPLAETLLALGPYIPVARDASWLGEPLPPADDVVFRLGFEGPRGDKALTIEACVQPVPELGAMVPGEGEEIIPVRRDGKVGHVARDLERELAEASALTRALGLPPAPMGGFAWRVVGLEPAVDMWTALTTAAKEGGRLRVEWKTKPLSVQRQRRVDKLQLRLGLKKDWLDVQGGFMLDGGELPIGELLKALRDKKRFVQVDDTRVLEIGEALAKELAPLAALARAGESKEGGKDGGGLRASLLAAPLIAELEALGAATSSWACSMAARTCRPPRCPVTTRATTPAAATSATCKAGTAMACATSAAPSPIPTARGNPLSRPASRTATPRTCEPSKAGMAMGCATSAARAPIPTAPGLRRVGKATTRATRAGTRATTVPGAGARTSPATSVRRWAGTAMAGVTSTASAPIPTADPGRGCEDRRARQAARRRSGHATCGAACPKMTRSTSDSAAPRVVSADMKSRKEWSLRVSAQ